MTQPAQMLAKILTSNSRALAGYAATEAVPNELETAEAAPETQFEGWQNLLAARLEELRFDARRLEARPRIPRELTDFVDAVVSKRAPRVTGEAGRRALAIAQSIADRIGTAK